MRVSGVALALMLISCGKDKDEPIPVDTGPEPWRPDVVCPGDAGCETATGQLYAGAAAVSITPTCFESWEDLDGNGEYDYGDEAFFDCGCDQLCEGDDGYPGADEGEGDGTFQAVWLAGFQNGRPATGVHDDLWARAVAFRQGDTTVALVTVDLVGFFNDEVVRIREAAADAGVDVDHIMVSSTHVHEGPDTMGLWGQYVGMSGVDPEYIAYIRAQALAAVEEAVAGLEPVTLTVGSADSAAPWPDKGTRNTIRDSRDPVVVDEIVYAAQLVGDDGDVVATLVNWGNHPEALSDENTLITSDFSHYIRESVEDGVTYDSYSVEGAGGVCLFVNGTVGGLMTPLGVTVSDGEGTEFGSSNFDKAQAIGRVIGELALQAIDEGEVAPDPGLAVRMTSFTLPIDNFGFQAMATIGVLDRETVNWDPDKDISDTNIPELQTEVDVLDVGPIRMLSVPGEAFPELAIGGYDGSRVNTPLDDFISPDNPNPPDVTQAPEAPYWKDRMGADYNWIIGLGNDELGYLVPPYDFVVDEGLPYLDEAEGDHYEETNSLGPRTVPLLEEQIVALLEWTPSESR